MIKKLDVDRDFAIQHGLLPLVDKLNEIIDYLSEREEASKYKVVSFDPVGKTVPVESVSKEKHPTGKSKCCGARMITNSSLEGTSWYQCSGCYKPCDQEVDKDGGECKKVCGSLHYHSFARFSDKCLGCKKSFDECNNPPEQEEVDKITKDYQNSFGDSFEAWSNYGWWIAYIQANFVSKEKIKAILKGAESKGDSGYCGKCGYIDTMLKYLGLNNN